MLQTKYYGINIFISHNNGNPEYWLVEHGNGGDEYIGHMPPTAAQVEEFRRKVMQSQCKWMD